MIELFTVIRTAYAATFANAVAGALGAHVEPALRLADGSLAVDGELELPMRVDMVPIRGPQAGQSVAIPCAGRMQFNVRTISIAPAIVYIAPFTWDDASIRVGGITAAQVGCVLAPWFIEWFDPDDANPHNEEGLFGVVHFASDPRDDDGIAAFELDLGSAPAAALEDLLERLAAAGARDVRLS